MRSSRLDFLKRRLIGKSKLEDYKKLANHFTHSKWIDLEATDKIIEVLKVKYLVDREYEIIPEEILKSFIESDLLRQTFKYIKEDSQSYIFTDDHTYCGSFLVNSKEAFIHALKIAYQDCENICFILDKNYQYYILINYYGVNHNDDPSSFEIQRSLPAQNLNS